jgi:hypothetical protein
MSALAMQVRANLILKRFSLDINLWPESLRPSLVTNSSTGMKTLASCAPYHNYIYSESLGFDSTLTQIESFFDCSGICAKSKFYSLTDISRYLLAPFSIPLIS